jgi:hypothetical protein
MNDQLADGVDALRPFVPAKDFRVSKRFTPTSASRFVRWATSLPLSASAASGSCFRIILSRIGPVIFVRHLLARNLDRWWEHISALDLASRYGVRAPIAPKTEPWGLRVAYVFDPSGVLWHFAQEANPSQAP